MHEIKTQVALAGGPDVRLQMLSFDGCVLKDATTCHAFLGLERVGSGMFGAERCVVQSAVTLTISTCGIARKVGMDCS